MLKPTNYTQSDKSSPAWTLQLPSARRFRGSYRLAVRLRRSRPFSPLLPPKVLTLLPKLRAQNGSVGHGMLVDFPGSRLSLLALRHSAAHGQCLFRHPNRRTDRRWQLQFEFARACLASKPIRLGRKRLRQGKKAAEVNCPRKARHFLGTFL